MHNVATVDALLCYKGSGKVSEENVKDFLSRVEKTLKNA